MRKRKQFVMIPKTVIRTVRFIHTSVKLFEQAYSKDSTDKTVLSTNIRFGKLKRATLFGFWTGAPPHIILR
jgi:hypothetical protein